MEQTQREIIHDILSGWQAQTVAREELIQLSLNKIDKHLETLNGKVYKHETIISQNLPHTIAHCPQNDVITEIHDMMTSIKAVNNCNSREFDKRIRNASVRWQIIAVVVSIFAFLAITYFGFKNMNTKIDSINKEVSFQSQTILEKRGFAPMGASRGADTLNIK